MALINIEYGALASSDTMNRNFSYLDDRISTTSDSISTNISSILSNIATINSRIGEVADDLLETSGDIGTTINQVKTTTNGALNSVTMVPNWSGIISISKPNNYTVPSNGFVLLQPQANSAGDLKVNSITVTIKRQGHENDYSSQMFFYSG